MFTPFIIVTSDEAHEQEQIQVNDSKADQTSPIMTSTEAGERND